jgi:hypothetical protein
MRTLLFSLVLASLSLFFASAAVAQRPQCNTRDTVLELLSQKYSEAPVAIGVANNGGLIEVLTSSEGVTFTIIITSPKGVSCLVAAGEGWRMYEAQGREPEA